MSENIASEKNIDIRKSDDLLDAVKSADVLLSKSYLGSLKDATIIQSNKQVEDYKDFCSQINSCVRFFDVSRVVLDKSENCNDKLVSVYNAIGTAGGSLLVLVQGDEKSVSVKFGVKSTEKKNVGILSRVLENSFKGNFPGSEIIPIRSGQLQSAIFEKFAAFPCVASITDIPGVRSKEKSEKYANVQGVEKFVDAMRGQKYTLLIVADPITHDDMLQSRKALENLYSALVPFCESQYSMSSSETDSVNESISTSVTETIGRSVTETTTHTVGKSTSTTNGSSTTKTINGAGAGAALGAVVGSVVPGAGTAVGTMIGGMIGAFMNFSKGTSKSTTEGTSTSDSTGTANSLNEASSTQNGTVKGTGRTEGLTRGLQIKFENHGVKKILERIEETLKRLDSCADLGMWNSAVYCISESEHVSQMAASVFHSLLRGKNSSLETSSVTIWDSHQSKLIKNELMYMTHPLMNICNLTVTPGTLVSSAELAIQAGIPNHSVPGIPVVECASFGRSVAFCNKTEINENLSLKLGKIYHMNQEEKIDVFLNTRSMCSHTFITGSTGSGKSNTVYRLLEQLPKLGVNFLVVEPAKGEYKHVFGNDETVSVYGTNPAVSEMLKINPFSFPKTIHVLEHVDRLVEIFNVCWPMYAAMPAVLKDAVIKSYTDCGWNILESTNAFGENLYPSFDDVSRNVRAIIESSDYDAENKGAYKGSLVTRLNSLTNGINGLLFVDDELSNTELFDSRVIVDLSRVGSSETKSLIMGILVLKLQEYRLASGTMNSELKHVTVLEEAHNLLKRTSTEQSQESANLVGKSVEMITNAIAEMRTYGEGFVIADQAPALLDMAVIRNTNTKIIMRLPDYEDRELVGKAANLNEDQVKELSKLPCGVAAVFQNDWVEPVLCKVEKASMPNGMFTFSPKIKNKTVDNDCEKLRVVELLCSGMPVSKEAVLKMLEGLSMPASTRVAVLNYLEMTTDVPRYRKLGPILKSLLPKVYQALVKAYSQTPNPVHWSESIDAAIRSLNENIEEGVMRDIRQVVITQYLLNEMSNENEYNEWRQRGVI